MEGLDIANRLWSPEQRDVLLQELEAARIEMEARSTVASAPTVSTGPVKDKTISHDVPVHIPPDLDRHVLRQYPLSLIRPYVNLQMLLGKHLGLRGNVEKLLQEGNEKAVSLLRMVEDLTEMVERDGGIQAHAAYRFFPAQADGDTVLVYDPADARTVLERFHFPRQANPPHLSLADFLRPVASGEMDYIALFTVTAGRGIRDLAERWKASGEYVKSHAIQAIAIEYAEGFAERLHHMLRDAWGIPDPPNMTMRERWIARYQGIRVSFGYPACPNIEDQEKLFRLLQPEDIGVQLTDGYMMDPEASVSAVVFAHPQARYFNVE
jgi:5-methyltetrahydrofolate--homocysteine methyltransferase